MLHVSRPRWRSHPAVAQGTSRSSARSGDITPHAPPTARSTALLAHERLEVGDTGFGGLGPEFGGLSPGFGGFGPSRGSTPSGRFLQTRGMLLGVGEQVLAHRRVVKAHPVEQAHAFGGDPGLIGSD